MIEKPEIIYKAMFDIDNYKYPGVKYDPKVEQALQVMRYGKADTPASAPTSTELGKINLSLGESLTNKIANAVKTLQNGESLAIMGPAKINHMPEDFVPLWNVTKDKDGKVTLEETEIKKDNKYIGYQSSIDKLKDEISKINIQSAQEVKVEKAPAPPKPEVKTETVNINEINTPAKTFTIGYRYDKKTNKNNDDDQLTNEKTNEKTNQGIRLVIDKDRVTKLEKQVEGLKNGESLAIIGPSKFGHNPEKEDFLPLWEIKKSDTGELTLVSLIKQDMILQPGKDTLPIDGRDYYQKQRIDDVNTALNTVMKAQEVKAEIEAAKPKTETFNIPVTVANGTTIGRDEMKQVVTQMLGYKKQDEKAILKGEVTFKSADGKEAKFKITESMMNTYTPALNSFALEKNLNTDQMADKFLNEFVKDKPFLEKSGDHEFVASQEVKDYYKSGAIKLAPGSTKPEEKSLLEGLLNVEYPYILAQQVRAKQLIMLRLSWQGDMLNICDKLEQAIKNHKELATEEQKQSMVKGIADLRTTINRMFEDLKTQGLTFDVDKQNSLAQTLQTAYIHINNAANEEKIDAKIQNVKDGKNTPEGNATLLRTAIEVTSSYLDVAQKYMSTMVAQKEERASAASVALAILDLLGDNPEKKELVGRYKLPKELDETKTKLQDIAIKSQAAIASFQEDLKHLPEPAKTNLTKNFADRMQLGNDNITTKKGNVEDLIRRSETNFENIEGLKNTAAAERVRAEQKNIDTLVKDFSSLIKTKESELAEIKKTLDKNKDALNFLFERSKLLKEALAEDHPLGDSKPGDPFAGLTKSQKTDFEFKRADLRAEMEDVNKQIGALKGDISVYETKMNDMQVEITDRQISRTEQLSKISEKMVIDQQSRPGNPLPSAGYTRIMGKIQEAIQDIKQQHNEALPRIGQQIADLKLEVQKLRDNLKTHEANYNDFALVSKSSTLNELREDEKRELKGTFKNTTDMFSARRYQDALLSVGDTEKRIHDTYNFVGPAVDILRIPFRKGRAFVNEGQTPIEKIIRGVGAIIAIPFIITISLPQMLESAVKSVGNFVNASANALGTVVHGAMSFASTALENIGKVCDKGVSKLAEIAADKEAGMGAKIAAKAAVLTVGTALKAVAGTCHVASNVMENVGIVAHEVCTLAGATARALTVPRELGTSLSMVGSSLTRLVANTASVATSAVKTVGEEVRDLGVKWDVPVVSETLKLVGGTVSGLGQGTEGVIQGTRQVITGEVRMGGRHMADAIADAGTKVAQDVSNDVVRRIQGKEAIPILESKTVVTHEGDKKETISLEEQNRRAKIGTGEKSAEQLTDLKVASYEKQKEEKAQKMAKTNHAHIGH